MLLSAGIAKHKMSPPQSQQQDSTAANGQPPKIRNSLFLTETQNAHKSGCKKKRKK
jgi:hypothetical protein